MQDEHFGRMITGLSTATRRSMLTMMMERGPMSLSGLANAFGVSEAAMGQRLKELRAADFVRMFRDGVHATYEVNRQALADVAEHIMNMASGTPETKTTTHRFDSGSTTCQGRTVTVSVR